MQQEEKIWIRGNKVLAGRKTVKYLNRRDFTCKKRKCSPEISFASVQNRSKQYQRKMSDMVRQGHKEHKNQLAMRHTDMLLPYYQCVKSVV